jgi:hypothetical protein
MLKYFSGTFSYGAKIQRNAYIKNHIDLFTLQFLCALYWVQEAMCYVAIIYVDFTLKNLSGPLHLIDFSATQPADKEEIESAKLESNFWIWLDTLKSLC